MLIYNFFSDSPFASKWRVLYQFLQEKKEQQDLHTSASSFGASSSPSSSSASASFTSSSSSPSFGFPKFDPAKHSLLCSELKILYVAVTRARQHLWFFESSSAFSSPILDLWLSEQLVTRATEKELRTIRTALQQGSTPEAWRKQGKICSCVSP